MFIEYYIKYDQKGAESRCKTGINKYPSQRTAKNQIQAIGAPQKETCWQIRSIVMWIFLTSNNF